ncbi:MAG: sulfurtransferase [Methanosarcinales archaeon]|nr:sulfurtransferase [Methanosarcinales archaeon]
MISILGTGLLGAGLLAAALVGPASAGCCGGEVWDPTAFLNSDVPLVGTSQAGEGSPSAASRPPAAEPEYRSDSFPEGSMLKSLTSVSSSELVVDCSYPGQGETIKGSVSLSVESLLAPDGTLRPLPELEEVLGDSGIAREDRVVVYGQPGQAALALWAMSYLGQEQVKLLDGSLKEWKEAGLPVDSMPASRPGVNYTSRPASDLLANYDYVLSGEAQLLDARSFQEFAAGRIPGASNFDMQQVVEGGRIRDRAPLEEAFSGLSTDRPVVVYSDDLGDASLLWCALELMGYDARTYSWQDWQAHSSTGENMAGNDNSSPVEGAASDQSSRFKRLGR